MLNPVFEAAGSRAFEAMPCMSIDHPPMMPDIMLPSGSLAAKLPPAYGLTRPFVTSGRQLCIVPEATLHFRPAVDSFSAHASFESLSGALAFVAEATRAGLAIGRVELLDASLAAAVTRRGALNLGTRPTLFFELHGEAEVADADGDAVEALLEAHGGDALNWASNPVAAAWLRQVRRGALAFASAERRGVMSRPIEVRVPIARLAETVERMHADAEAAGIAAYILGHVGKGNVRCVLVHAPDEAAVVEALAGRIALRAIAAGGRATGEPAAGFGRCDPGRADTVRRRSIACAG